MTEPSGWYLEISSEAYLIPIWLQLAQVQTLQPCSEGLQLST